jgi:hypothetical protein
VARPVVENVDCKSLVTPAPLDLADDLCRPPLMEAKSRQLVVRLQPYMFAVRALLPTGTGKDLIFASRGVSLAARELAKFF